MWDHRITNKATGAVVGYSLSSVKTISTIIPTMLACKGNLGLQECP